MARPRKPGHRRPDGSLSEARGARPDRDDGLVRNQPHRRPFAALLGDHAAASAMAASALGRLVLIGQAEEMHGVPKVRQALLGARDKGADALGISQRLYHAGMKYAEAYGRERWVRSAPKDKPSAIAFMEARGIDLAAREMSDADARHYLEQFEESRAVLMAAPCSGDLRRVLRSLRVKLGDLRRLPGGSRSASMVDDVARLMRGIGALINPAATAAVVQAVNTIVIDDRDPDARSLKLARIGLAALADYHFGPEREDSRPLRGAVKEKPGWVHEVPIIEVLYPDGAGGTRTAHKVPQRREKGGGWKGRHRSLSGGSDGSG